MGINGNLFWRLKNETSLSDKEIDCILDVIGAFFEKPDGDSLVVIERLIGINCPNDMNAVDFFDILKLYLGALRVGKSNTEEYIKVQYQDN